MKKIELTEADEKMIEREAFIEEMKGPSPWTPGPEEDTRPDGVRRAAFIEQQKRPTPLPPRAVVDFVQQRREALIMERRMEALKGPIKTSQGVT